MVTRYCTKNDLYSLFVGYRSLRSSGVKTPTPKGLGKYTKVPPPVSDRWRPTSLTLRPSLLVRPGRGRRWWGRFLFRFPMKHQTPRGGKETVTLLPGPVTRCVSGVRSPKGTHHLRVDTPDRDDPRTPPLSSRFQTRRVEAGTGLTTNQVSTATHS